MRGRFAIGLQPGKSGGYMIKAQQEKLLKTNMKGNRPKRRKKRSSECCDDCDHVIVAIVKMSEFFGIVVTCVFGIALVVYLVTSTDLNRVKLKQEGLPQITGSDEWLLRRYFTSPTCVESKEILPKRTNAYRLNYCENKYGSSTQYTFAFGNLTHKLWLGSDCHGTPHEVIHTNVGEPVTEQLVNGTKSCLQVAASVPHATEPVYGVSTILQSRHIDPRNPTTADVPLLLMQPQDEFLHPEISATGKVMKPAVTARVCFHQVMDKVVTGYMVPSWKIESCGGNKATMECLGISEYGKKKVPEKSNDECFRANNEWGFLWRFAPGEPVYEDPVPSLWAETFFIGAAILIGALVIINALQEVYFMFTDEEYWSDERGYEKH